MTQEITGLGARLKSARIAMHLSEKDAGTRLHLNARIITLLEEERFSDGPPATFLRGYLRSYARLLNLPDDEINAAIDRLSIKIPPRQTTTAKPSVPLTHPQGQRHYIRLMTSVVVLIILGLVGAWWSSRSNHETPEVTAPSVAPETPVVAAPVPEPAPAPAAVTTPAAPPPPAQAITPPEPAKTETPEQDTTEPEPESDNNTDEDGNNN